MLGAFAETSAAAVPQRSSCAAAQLLPCCQRHFVLSLRKPHNKFHGIQNWVSKGSYKTRIWFSQKGRSAGFYVSSELLGFGVLFPASQSVTVFLRQFQLRPIRELSDFPIRRSRHFYFFTVDGSILLPSGESELWRRLVEVFTSTLYLLCVSVLFYFQY
jgi:hypothetical protein